MTAIRQPTAARILVLPALRKKSIMVSGRRCRCSPKDQVTMIDFFLRAGKTKILAAVGCLIAVIAVTDWAVGNSFSLGVLYILPMMLGALVLRRSETAVLAVFCALLRSRFDTPSTQLEAVLRFVFASVSYFACGLFVTALVRNRQFLAGPLTVIG